MEAEAVTAVTEVVASEGVEVSVGETAEATEVVAAAEDLAGATKWEEGWLNKKTHLLLEADLEDTNTICNLC